MISPPHHMQENWVDAIKVRENIWEEYFILA